MTNLATQLQPHRTTPTDPPSFARKLEQEFGECGLVRPFRRTAHEPGDRLEYAITGVLPAHAGRMVVEVERFVGGGFAGQVYKVWLLEVHADEGPIAGLEVGRRYAVKVLRPPSGFARLFRDFLYFLAYQGPFAAQANPAGVRVGVLWQKLIRRAASLRFGEETAVCDTYATFYDDDLHSFGEINEWIDGRIWKFEVDDDLFGRWAFRGAPPADHNSPEYVHKKRFMRELVCLLHEMGAGELARQYEWWTCKSQPNALKRLAAGASPKAGLTAVDFRAGLALLPFAPMSPADVWLILRGLVQGRIVQFDRSDPVRLEEFLDAHGESFADLQPAIDELRQAEAAHRASLPDLTHHRFRLLTDGNLRRSVKSGIITGWQHLGRLDEDHAARLRRGRVLFPLLYCLVLIPFLGTAVVKLWGSTVRRTHLKRCLTSGRYLWRAMRGARIETLVIWHRKGRGCEERLRRLVHRPVRYWLQRILCGWMPPKWHRFLTEPAFARDSVRNAVGFVYQFLRVPSFREQWLLGEVEAGRHEGMLTDAEADHIAGEIKDPFIQKYLRCLAVHLCTLPITQIVMVVAGTAVGLYLYSVQHVDWGKAVAAGTAVAAAIQVAPISPGSISRGLFVLYLMIRERDVRNYYIAAPVSFVHVLGYLAFPFQMVAHDAALARFLAGRWAKNLTHVVPVFGESGGLLEHFVFDLFFNFPLTMKRGFKTRPLRWAAGTLLALAAVAAAVYILLVGAYRLTHPVRVLDDVKVAAVAPVTREGADAPTSFDVQFEEIDGRVPFPADAWDARITAGDVVDARVRASWFGAGLTGEHVAPASSSPTSAPAPMDSPEPD